MFGFFSNLRKEVTQAVSSIHERLITLEVKVEALFNHVNTVAEAPIKSVELGVAEAEAKAQEAVAETKE